MTNQDNYISFRCEVTISVYCPHKSVDQETVEEAARAAVLQNCIVVPRRWNTDKPDGPEFGVYAEVMEMEIEDDWLDDERPKEFSASDEWWQQCERRGQ